MKLSTILLYSTIDHRWLDECLSSACEVSNEVIVVTCDRFWNGQLENEQSVLDSHKIIESYKNAKLITTSWSPGYPTFFWEAQCRVNGILNTSHDCDYILFLDTDEIIDVNNFTEWLETKEYANYDSMKLANYWYFREKNYRSNTTEDSIVLINKDFICYDGAMVVQTLPTGREQYHELMNCNKKRMVVGTDGNPMIHHYSWVRTKDEMIQKVKSWGHNKDRNWIPLIEEEFSRPFNGKCFVNDMEFEVLDDV